MCFKNFVYLIVLASFAIVAINEFFIYSIYRLRWNSIQCRTANCTTVLFVADPQILGETLDTHFYSSIAIKDADRYLKNTFVRAFAFAKPDVVCFLGDLMDEGSIADNDAYQRYLKRFYHIFKTNANTQRIFIPGDNDVGGEGSDYVTTSKLNRFQKAFNESDSLTVNNRFKFWNINLLTHKYPDINGSEAIRESAFVKNIVLTHLSVLSYVGLTMKTVSDKIR